MRIIYSYLIVMTVGRQPSASSQRVEKEAGEELPLEEAEIAVIFLQKAPRLSFSYCGNCYREGAQL